MNKSIISLIVCAGISLNAYAQKSWHQDLINLASGSGKAEVSAVVNREPNGGRLTNARYRIYIQPAVAAQVKSKLMGHQKEAQQYSLEPKKLMMSFDDNGVRTNYSLSLKGRKRLLLISQQRSDGTYFGGDGNVVVIDGESAEARREAAEARRQAQLQAAEARRQAAEARREAQLQAAEARSEALLQAAEARSEALFKAAEARREADLRRNQAAEARRDALEKAAEERRRQADERRRQADERRRQADERRRQAETVRRGNNVVKMISDKPTELQKQEIENIENSLRKERERRKRELQ